jgi:putative holliday junction resolvase
MAGTRPELAARYNATVSIVAIDYGARRIGIAVSDSGVLATPHSVLRNDGYVLEKIAAIGRELDAELFVVGIARRATSTAGERRFRDFAELLRQKTSREVVLWDEALTTVEASEQLRTAGKKRREAERTIDMQAAAVILQAYLDDRARRPS